MAFLTLRFSTDGRDTLQIVSRRAPIGEPRLDAVRALAAANGYEVRGLGTVDRAEWPLRCVAYKSPRRDGLGRYGGQFWEFPARPIVGGGKDPRR